MSAWIERAKRAQDLILALADLGDLQEAGEALAKLQPEIVALASEYRASKGGYGDEQRARSIETKRRNAREVRATMLPLIRKLQGQGRHTIGQIIDSLDEMGVESPGSASGRWARGTIHGFLAEIARETLEKDKAA